jgi:hypothetical protein
MMRRGLEKAGVSGDRSPASGPTTGTTLRYQRNHMLRYLVEDYWGRRSGWPDLIVFRENEFFFAEVKSATDKLGRSQQRWLRDNRERLHFPFKLVEVRKMELEFLAGA